MDVDQIKLQGICSEDMSPEQSVSPDVSSTCDDFRDPELFPRIGNEYQAIIPLLVVKSDDFRPLKSQAGGLLDTYIGLPVPVERIDGGQSLKQEQHNGSDNIVLASDQNEHLAVTTVTRDVSEAREVKPCDDMRNKDSENATNSGDSTNFLLQQEMKINMNENNVDNGQGLIPDSLNDYWSDIERASLLLGLYIFGKNLIQVKKFVGSKQMGDILSFYYGKFYGSEKYRRWSTCRKARGKRCICGQKLFSGWRQQELASRLLSSLSEEKKNTVVEVYIFTPCWIICQRLIDDVIFIDPQIRTLTQCKKLTKIKNTCGETTICFIKYLFRELLLALQPTFSVENAELIC